MCRKLQTNCLGICKKNVGADATYLLYEDSCTWLLTHCYNTALVVILSSHSYIVNNYYLTFSLKTYPPVPNLDTHVRCSSS